MEVCGLSPVRLDSGGCVKRIGRAAAVLLLAELVVRMTATSHRQPTRRL